MKKKVIFEGIFILILISILSYFIIAVLITETTKLQVVAPLNNTNLSTKIGNNIVEYNFTCNATNLSMVDTQGSDNSSISNMSIWGDIVNVTNSGYRVLRKNISDTIGNESYGFNISNMSDGIYKWACVVGYTNGSIHRSPNYTLIVDTSAPLINSTAQNTTISNGTWVSNNSIRGGTQSDWAISTTAYDLGLANCTLVHNFDGVWAAKNLTNHTVTNGTQFTFNFLGLPYFGNITANRTGFRYDIYCYDNTNHTSAVNVTLFVDGQYPVGSISTTNSSSLTSYENWSDETVNISGIAGDIGGSGIVNCSLYGDFDGAWARNQTKDPVLNDTNFEFHLNLSTNNTGYNYNILCKDAANNRKNLSTGIYSIRVDSGSPSATLKSSAGTSLSLSQSTTLSCATTDDIAIDSTSIDVCSGASSCTYKMATTTSQTATCTVTDKLGHSATSSITLTSSEGGGGSSSGGGGSGGGTTTTTETTTISETPTTITSTEGAGSIIPLTIMGGNYDLGIVNVGVASTSITIAGQDLQLVVGETQPVDVNGDGTNDIEITLNSISGSKPQFTIKEIKLAAPSEEAGVGEEVVKTGMFAPLKIGLIIFALAAIIVTILILRNRKR